ncbi:MAG: hypothetical protein WBE21_06135 [Candidatus Acidiferrales bacterium]|jgi:hypothetical protein
MKLGHFGFGRVTAKQVFLTALTTFAVALPLILYIIFVVGPSETVDLRKVGIIGLGYMLIGVPLLAWVLKRWVLRDK